MIDSRVFSLSNDGGAAMEREVRVSPTLVPDTGDLEFYFEISRCVSWINSNGFKKVCIQFPDSLLGYSVAVGALLEKQTGERIHILADSTYGSCCVDEKTALHVGGDSIIHFGPSCLSQTQRTPVLFIFTRPNVDLTKTLQLFRSKFDTKEQVVILYDTIYESLAKDLFDEIKSGYPKAILSTLVIPGTTTDDEKDDWILHGRRISNFSSGGKSRFFYIGGSGRTLLNFLLNVGEGDMVTYDPITQTSEERGGELTRLVMRRNFYMEKLKDASTVGILVGTLAVDGYLGIIEQLKQNLHKASKRFYVVQIGDITPPKLANFPQIEVFVLVACPESTMVDSKEFFQPILTPYEVDVALNRRRDWKGDILLDYRPLLLGGNRHVLFEPSQFPDLSLLSGELRINTEWKGLNESEAATSEKMITGRSGRAEHYMEEPINK